MLRKARLAKFESGEDVRVMSPKVLTLYEQVLSPAWGFTARALEVLTLPPAPIPQGKVAEAEPDSGTESSSSYSSSSSSSAASAPSTPRPVASGSNAEPAQKAVLRWILPTRTAAKLHLKLGTVDDRGRVIPPCRARPYVFGYREGEGLSGALATGAKWCTECARFARERGHDLEAEL